MSSTDTINRRFWSKVEQRGPNECWPWLAMTNSKGHGKFQVSGSCGMAHRVAYELTRGAIPAGLLVRHTCDQPDCVNPKHLVLGTIAENNADHNSRGRQPRKPRLAQRQDFTYRTPPQDLRPRFMAGFSVRENGCWNWTKGRFHFGHGAIAHRGRTLRAHRVAYELLIGPIPAGLHVLHRCDNPSCVNPEHLRVGTHAENMAEMRERKRAATGERNGAKRHAVRGERVARSVLTEDAVREIRSSATPYEVGIKHGVSKPAVSHVLAKRCWKHVV